MSKKCIASVSVDFHKLTLIDKNIDNYLNIAVLTNGYIENFKKINRHM